MRIRNKQAQSFIEYAVLIGVVVGALIAMRIFIARSVQAKFKQSADVFGSGEQYEKGVTQVTDLGDAGIESVAKTEEVYDTCPRVLKRVTELEAQAEDLAGKAESLGQAAQDTQAQIQDLKNDTLNMRSQADNFAAEAKSYRKQAQDSAAEADRLQTLVDNCKRQRNRGDDDNSNCTFYGLWEMQIAQLRKEANQANVMAQSYEDVAGQLKNAVEVLENEAIPQMEEQGQRLMQETGVLRERAVAAEEEMNQIREGSPDCFE